MNVIELDRSIEPSQRLAAPPESPRGISTDDVSQDFVRRVPIAFARRFGVLGLKAENGCQLVAVSEKSMLAALDKLAVLLGKPTRPVFVDEDVLRRMISEAYGRQASGVEQVIEALPGADPLMLVDELSRSGDLLDTTGSSPVTKLVNLVLFEAVKRRASDVHVQPFEDHLQIRLRIDGVLYDYVCPPTHLLDEIVSRIKVMGKMNIAEKRLAQDGRTTVKVGDKTIDLRISTLPTSFGERVVLRLLDKSARLYRLPELGMSERDLVEFRELITRTSGIVLVTGPTGSGKSTTLYAALQELNCKELNVLTLEDPIEYQLPGISQTQVSDKKGMTFATGLRHVLRQDPDVIMVGEIRDQETARMAIQSSLTGHLVFSTLHTNDAAGAVARLLDLGVEPYLVSGSLLGVLAQRLVRRVCEHCKAPRALTPGDVDLWQLSPTVVGSTVYEAIGCERCHQTGYHERMGIFELLRISEEVRELLHHQPQTRLLKEAARKAGMTTLHEDGVRKWLSGTTTLDEVCRVTTAETVL
ncbi:MAG: type II secretion system ATPase GspE [Planctomycetota bacterium]